VKPKLDEKNVKLLFVSIGTGPRGLEFAKETGFPAESIYADPDNKCYDALGFVKGVRETFFDAATPFAILERIQTSSTGDLMDILPRWKPWIPPKLDQGFQQGGVLVFEGTQVLMTRKDPATGAHISTSDLLAASVADL